MNMVAIRTALAVVALAGCASAPMISRGTVDQHPVYHVFNDGIAAFNSKDLDVFMQQWDDDIQMYTADVGWLRGKGLVRERFSQTFQRFPRVHMEIDSLRVTPLAPTVANVDFIFRTYPNGAGPAFHGVGTGTYVLRGKRWVEVLEHESIVSVDEALRRPR